MPKSKRSKPISLAPLTVDEVLEALLKTPPPADTGTKEQPTKKGRPAVAVSVPSPESLVSEREARSAQLVETLKGGKPKRAKKR